MTIYAGLDVSDKTTHLCVVDADGVVLKRDVVASDPDVIAKWLDKHCPGLIRVVLETGPLSTFLYHGLIERSIPVDCICARHAKGVLATRVNKSDVHDTDPMLRRALFEAANIMLSRVQRPFALKIWGQRIAEAKGNKRARIAVARKLAVLLHRLWLHETEFRWT